VPGSGVAIAAVAMATCPPIGLVEEYLPKSNVVASSQILDIQYWKLSLNKQ
jgi:hypothetical protein